jgi:hypothetical protein
VTFGVGFSAELTDAILNDPVRIRDVPVLWEMFKPGCNYECFEEAPPLSRQQFFEAAQCLAGIRMGT